MSFKANARIPATEPSLLDVFGPNISDEVKATNQRAAELSMGDMAKVLNPSASSGAVDERSITVTIEYPDPGAIMPRTKNVNFSQKSESEPLPHHLF